MKSIIYFSGSPGFFKRACLMSSILSELRKPEVEVYTNVEFDIEAFAAFCLLREGTDFDCRRRVVFVNQTSQLPKDATNVELS